MTKGNHSFQMLEKVVKWLNKTGIYLHYPRGQRQTLQILTILFPTFEF